MKTKIKILLTEVALITLFNDCCPQTSETLKKGSFYSITLDNGSVIQGKVMSFDSTIILLKTKTGLSEIQRQDILNIRKPNREYFTDYFAEYKKPVYKKYISLNTGFVFPETVNDNEEYYYDYTNGVDRGFDFSIGYTGFFGRNLGIRSVASFSVMANKEVQRNTGYDYYSRTGGSLSEFLLKLDFLAGLFHPEKKINFYALAGIGLGQVNSSNVTENRTYYYYPEDTYTYSYNYDPELQWILRYGIGGGATLGVSDNIALQAEVVYDHVTAAKGYYDNMNQIVINAGIIFVKF